MTSVTRSTAPSGQVLIEFALVLPLFLFIVVGGLGLGITLVNRMQLQHAAQEVAVEAATVNCTEALTRADALLGYQPQTATCDVSGQMVTVNLAHSFAALLPFLPESISVTARAVQR
jgi:hypothetical protein